MRDVQMDLDICIEQYDHPCENSSAPRRFMTGLSQEGLMTGVQDTRVKQETCGRKWPGKL